MSSSLASLFKLISVLFLSFRCFGQLVLMFVIRPMPKTEGGELRSLPLRIRMPNFSHQSVKNSTNGLQINTPFLAE